MTPLERAKEARRDARLERAAEAGRRVIAQRGEILDALSTTARAGVLARAARLENV